MFKYFAKKIKNGYGIYCNNKFYDFYPNKESAMQYIEILKKSDKNHCYNSDRITDFL